MPGTDAGQVVRQDCGALGIEAVGRAIKRGWASQLFFSCQAAVRRSDILENFARRGGAERAPR